jgi:adenylyl-sulfate kinase
VNASSSTSPGPVGRGHAFWLFGLSGAGKSTLADRLADSLRQQGIPVLSLDGDRLRHGLCAGLGFTEADRTENLRRAAEVAQLGTASGLCVVASFITPLAAQRAQVRRIVDRDHLALIYLNASLQICRTRDVKGLYAQAAVGRVANMTGVSAAFEPADDAELVLDTGLESVDQSFARLRQFTQERLHRSA